MLSFTHKPLQYNMRNYIYQSTQKYIAKINQKYTRNNNRNIIESSNNPNRNKWIGIFSLLCFTIFFINNKILHNI
jgi:hypothetical protein